MGDGVESSANENNNSSKNIEVVIMDTPERAKSNQIATSIGKFEESPVFNFLNSLSPIKPVKSIHITQTINPLSFASFPSIFTSPHVLRESRFLRRHQLADPSKPEFSSIDRSTVETNNISTDAADKLDEQPKNLIPRESEYACNSGLVPFVEGGPSQGGSYASEMITEGVSQIDENKEATSCDWESLIADASDMLIFESPNGTDSSYKQSIEAGTGFCMSMEYEMQNRHSLCAVASAEQAGDGTEPEHLSTQPGEGNEMIENDDITAGPSMNFPGEKSDYEHLPGFHRGIRRRCLVFEMMGARRMCLDESSGPDSVSDGNASPDGQPVGPIRTVNDPSHCVLPGIGLHLNALATTPKDYKIVNHDSSASGRLLIAPSPSVNLHAPTSGQELMSHTLPYSSSEREINNVENVVQPTDDACLANEEINPSPKKKRRREAGEAEACKRCNCKKSKCLKLYCECFAAGVYCVEPCACIDCFNKPIHEDTVLATRKQIESRNPLAFAPKVIRGSDSVSEAGDDSSKTPASARHKRGCNCKKSGCLKKYCECYQGGVGCSINCRCEGCKNAFGRKDGPGVIGTEAEMEEDEADTTEKAIVDRSFQKTPIHNNVSDQNMDSGPPTTPLLARRQSLEYPFSSKNKPPRSSFPSMVGSSSGLYTSQGFTNNPSLFQLPAPKFDKHHLETVREDEMPEFLQGGSPINGGIKSLSPNQKRVSPPRSAGISPSLRSSRKLILKSIPSFPSLTPNQ